MMRSSWIFKRSVTSVLNLTAKPIYSFTRFPSNAQRRLEKNSGNTGFKPTQIFTDDLYYPMENDIHKKSLDDLINHIKTHPNLTIESRGLCTILYMIAKYDRDEPFIFRELERHLYKFKENLSARLAFGGLYAAYKCNHASTYQVSFFEDEVTRHISDTSGHDAVELLLSMNLNTTKVNKHKADYYYQTLRPIILREFKNGIKPYNQTLYNLFIGLRDMKIYDEEVFEMVLKYLPYRKGQTDVQKVADVYESLCVFKENQLLQQNLDAHIAHLESRLSGRADFKWRYNLAEKRLLSYDDLIANRENYEAYSDQKLHKYRFSNPELVEKFILVQSDKDAIKAEHEARERSRELENLVLEMFDLKNRGEISQAEDKNTLMGSYENIEYVKEGEEGEEEEELDPSQIDDTPHEEVDDGMDISLKSERVKLKGDKKKRKSHKLIPENSSQQP